MHAPAPVFRLDPRMSEGRFADVFCHLNIDFTQLVAAGQAGRQAGQPSFDLSGAFVAPFFTSLTQGVPMIISRHASSPSPFTLQDLMDLAQDPRYRPSTRRRNTIVFRKLIRHFGPIPVQDLTRQAILQCLANTQCSASTAVLELRILRAALVKATALGLVQAPIVQSLFPRSRVIRPPRHRRPLTPQEVLQILQSSESWIQSPILFAIHTGLRFHELANLKWEHVDWERGQLTVPDRSVFEGRRIPLLKTARMILDRLRSLNSCSGILFTTPRGRCLDQGTSALVRESARKAGIPDSHFHDFRTTFVAWCADAGVPNIPLAEIAGCSKLSVFSWIVEPRPEDVLKHLPERNNFVKMAKLLKQNPSALNPIIVP